jgi:Histidine biosynthesis protein
VTPARTPSPLAPGADLMPCVLLRRGEVCVPGPEGPEVVRGPDRRPLDPFDVLDRLRSRFSRLYLVDLDGIERANPQVEYIQEFSRDVDLWVDAGVASAEAAIDILVAGAQRAILSSSHLRAPVELKRAWKLSTDWAFEVDLDAARQLVASQRWVTRAPAETAALARSVGITEVVVSPREVDPDWTIVAEIARGGPTWVDGTFTEADVPRLRAAGATGGIFHIQSLLDVPAEAPTPAGVPDPPRARDDEE